ncbi:MAG: putative acyl esterase [Paraglaciecola sp.]|jgi:predicted acyl esterase
MTAAQNCPCKIRHIEHCWIPMADGIRLSARIWMPEGAETKPVPAIFEYIPYRKRDGVGYATKPCIRILPATAMPVSV